MTELPASLLDDFSDYEKNQPVGFFQGVIASAVEESEQGFIKPLVAVSDYFTDSPAMSEDEWKHSNYYRPELKYQPGLTEIQALNAARFYDDKKNYEATLDRIDNKLLRTTSSFVGSTLGFVLTGYALGMEQIPVAMGRMTPAILDLFTEATLAKKAANVAIGAAGGIAYVAPQAVAEYEADKFYGEDPSIIMPLVTIGLGAGLGGLIHGFKGVKQSITNEADAIAKETAVNQLASGKSVRVDELMQHGAYEADLHSLYREAAPYQDNIARLPKDRQQVFVENLGERIRAQNQAKNTEAFISDLQKSKEELLPIAGQKLALDDVKNLNQEIYGLRKNINKIDKSFDDYLARIKEENKQKTYKEAVREANKAIESDRQPLQEALNTAESKLKNHDIAAAAEAELSRIDQHLSEVRKGQATEIKKLESLTKLFEPQFINKPISPKRIIDGDYSLEDLVAKEPIGLSIARQRLQNNVASLMLDSRRTKPLTTEQVKAASEHMQSYKSDSTYNEAESKAFTDEVNALPENIDADIEHVREQAEALRESLPEDIKQSLDDMKTASEQTEKVSGALQKIIECLRGE